MYGENSGLLRDSLRELLTQHRIQRRIGGAGSHTVPESTTVEERREIGEQIGRFRHAVLGWCRQALSAADPHIYLTGNTARSRKPVDELRYRLDAAISADAATRPTLDELTTEQPFPMVELWRQAARACALGEHDFDAGVGYGRLSAAQCRTLVRDAAEITRALVGLDRRYAKIPGWQPLKEPGRLSRAAEICAAYAGSNEPDYSVDGRGWKPPAQLIEGPGLPGIAGVLQAQHNVLLHLAKFPDAKRLRVVLDSQRVVSLETARRLGDTDPAPTAHWEWRAEVYGRLVHHARDLGGTIGNGGPAAGQGSVAAVRMQNLPADAVGDHKQVERLERISSGIDQRVGEVIEHGIKERLYFQNVLVPAIENEAGDLVADPHNEWLPVTYPVRADLLTTLRRDLRPFRVEQTRSLLSAQNRRDFEAAIDHRPGDVGPAVSV